MVDSYNVKAWFWLVGGDTSRAWSSAAGAYVQSWPASRVTRIVDETELSDVLRPHGLAVPAPTAVDVKAEAQRRIIALTGAASLIDCIIKQSNANMRANELNDKHVSGEALSAAEETEAAGLRTLAVAIKAVRAASNIIEALAPIPVDYKQDEYWT